MDAKCTPAAIRTVPTLTWIDYDWSRDCRFTLSKGHRGVVVATISLVRYLSERLSPRLRAVSLANDQNMVTRTRTMRDDMEARAINGTKGETQYPITKCRIKRKDRS